MKIRLLSLAFLFCASVLGAEGPDISAWSITVKGGTAYPVFGEFTGSAGEQTSSSTDDDGNVTTTGNNVNINSLNWDDAFGDFVNFAVELDFWESPTRSLYVGVSRTMADGKTANFGTFNNATVTANFSDYSDTGLYAGFRWGLGQPASWIRSLVSLQLGATIVDGIDAKVTNIPNYSTIGIYKNTTVFSAGAFVSVIITPLEFFEIGIDSGFQYQTGLDGDNAQLELLGLTSINSEGQLGLVPVRVFATIKF